MYGVKHLFPRIYAQYSVIVNVWMEWEIGTVFSMCTNMDSAEMSFSIRCGTPSDRNASHSVQSWYISARQDLLKKSTCIIMFPAEGRTYHEESGSDEMSALPETKMFGCLSHSYPGS